MYAVPRRLPESPRFDGKPTQRLAASSVMCGRTRWLPTCRPVSRARRIHELCGLSTKPGVVTFERISTAWMATFQGSLGVCYANSMGCRAELTVDRGHTSVQRSTNGPTTTNTQCTRGCEVGMGKCLEPRLLPSNLAADTYDVQSDPQSTSPGAGAGPGAGGGSGGVILIEALRVAVECGAILAANGGGGGGAAMRASTSSGTAGGRGLCASGPATPGTAKRMKRTIGWGCT